jgi:hypothetical protein
MNSASLSIRLASNLKTKNAPIGFLQNPTTLEPVGYSPEAVLPNPVIFRKGQNSFS